MMYRDGKQVVSEDEHNFVLNHGALGDIITSLPPIAFARQMYPTMRFKVWVPPWQTDLLKHVLAPYGEFEFLDVTKFPKTRTERIAMDMAPLSLNTAVNSTHTRCRVHMVDYAYNFLINAQPESMEQRSYLTKAPLGPKRLDLFDTASGYVVFPVGATSNNKLFRASVMGPVMQWCLDNDYAVVIVGTKTSHTATEVDGEMKPIVIREQTDLLPVDVFKRCIDMREKTTLLELRDLLGHASAVVGVDGGTLHLAGTTDVPIVFASGTTLPKHRYIARHGDPHFRVRYVGPRDLECYGCQSNWPLLTIHFTECVYGDNACMGLLHPDDFTNGLKELGL
jgi:ADP-heptose:LPS heptosyltransferase